MRKSIKTLFLIIPICFILGVAGRVYPIEIGNLGGGNGGGSGTPGADSVTSSTIVDNSITGNDISNTLSMTDTTLNIGSLTVSAGNFRVNSAGSTTVSTLKATGSVTASTMMINELGTGVANPVTGSTAFRVTNNGTANNYALAEFSSSAGNVVITNAARVGIGTTTPTTPLHVVGTVTAINATISDNVGIGTTTPNYKLQVTDNSADLGFVVGSSGSITAKTLTVTGTATAANLTTTNLTVTGTAQLPSQASTTGSASVSVGSGQSYTMNSTGSSTNTIVLNCSGVISATNTGSMDLSGLQGGVTLGTTTYSNRYNKPKHLAVSTAIATATASLTGTTTETAMATVLVPAGFMAPTGSFLIYTNWSAPAGEGAAKTINLRFGTGTGTTGSLLMGNALLGSTIQSAVSFVSFGNFGSTTKQMGQRRFDVTTATAQPYITSINTALDTYIVITATLGTVTDTVNLETYWMDYKE